MKISGSGPIHPTPTRPGRAARANKRSSFASAMSGDPAPTSNVTSAAPIGPVDGILAVQEVPTATDERSRGIKRGHDLLDRLDDIR